MADLWSFGKMDRDVVVLRFAGLVLLPAVAFIVVASSFESIIGYAGLFASLPAFANVAFSIKDGVVLERGGTLCERKKAPAWFWAWIVVHTSFGAFFVALGFMVFAFT